MVLAFAGIVGAARSISSFVGGLPPTVPSQNVQRSSPRTLDSKPLDLQVGQLNGDLVGSEGIGNACWFGIVSPSITDRWPIVKPIRE